jgi:Uma2 family endonuclease
MLADCQRTEGTSAGVPLVWVVHPSDRTVIVYGSNANLELCNIGQELSVEPHLPGFRVPVARLFE